MRTFFLLFLVSIIAQAQNATTYVNHRNEKHLCGVLNYKSWKKTVFIPLGITTIIQDWRLLILMLLGSVN